MPDKPPVIRANDRQRLVTTARLRRGGRTVDCKMVNLSETGCKLMVTATFAEVGDTVFVRPDGLETQTGTVRWKNDDSIGVEFVQSVYRPVVDHLVRSSFTLR